jgi:catechol 2,3-dioxygenase-like lactoylglutathione lyase family enzyme
VSPTLSGLHHLKLPVADLDAATAWWAAVFDARRVPRLDHIDDAGTRYAVVLEVPGLGVPLQLLLLPAASSALPGYDPVTLGVPDRRELDRWTAHLTALGVTHTPVAGGVIGDTLVLQTPEGALVRLYTLPPGGFGPEFAAPAQD